MIVFEKFGRTIRISNADWKQLRKRYNPKNAVFTKDKFRIEVFCTLCDKFLASKLPSCGNCPFHQFSEYYLGCFEFINLCFPKGTAFDSDDIRCVTWKEEDDKEVRFQLMGLQKEMDKIEKMQ